MLHVLLRVYWARGSPIWGWTRCPPKRGMAHVFSETFKASDLVTRVIVIFAMLFATVEAAHRLDFTRVEVLVGMFIKFGGDVPLGVGILPIGFWLAHLATGPFARKYR